MSDEAAPYYVDMVDQQTIGHQFLLSNFGPSAIPKTGWQVLYFVFGMHECVADMFAQDRSLWPLHDDGNAFLADGDGLVVFRTYRLAGMPMLPHVEGITFLS